MANQFSLKHLWEEFRAFDIDDRLTTFSIPIVFMLGRHDWHMPAVLAAYHFERIHAADRRLVWCEQSAHAHNPPLEEPDRFNRAVVDALKPLTVSERV